MLYEQVSLRALISPSFWSHYLSLRCTGEGRGFAVFPSSWPFTGTCAQRGLQSERLQLHHPSRSLYRRWRMGAGPCAARDEKISTTRIKNSLHQIQRYNLVFYIYSNQSWLVDMAYTLPSSALSSLNISRRIFWALFPFLARKPLN